MSILGEYDRSRIPLWVAAVALLLMLAFVIYSYIGTYVLGLFIYYITRPIHRRLSRVVRPQSLAAGISLLTITLPVILLVGYTVYAGTAGTRSNSVGTARYWGIDDSTATAGATPDARKNQQLPRFE